MIIDLILDRYHGDAYDPKKFYDAVMDYEEGTEYPISRALDDGEEEDVKRALCDYVDGEYNPNIKKYINAVEWLKGDDGKDYSKEIDIMAEKKESIGKEDDDKLTFKLTEIPKELNHVYRACKKRFWCEPVLNNMVETGDHDVYNFSGEYGSYLNLLVVVEHTPDKYYVTVKGLDDTDGYEYVELGKGEADTIQKATADAMAGVDKNMLPLAIKIRRATKSESKNESDFGAFDWTVTVSYTDKETGDKASDVFLIKAHNMPSAKEQAILRANRKGTDAKVDSCRMGDYVSNESKTSEASPRKWRAEPSDRGVGGKWGPADTYNINRDDREQSAKNWSSCLKNAEPFKDDEFRQILKGELDDDVITWDNNPEHQSYIRFLPNYRVDYDDKDNPKNSVVMVELVLDPECPDEKTAKRFAGILRSKLTDPSNGFVYDVIVEPRLFKAGVTPADEDEWHVVARIQVTNAGLLDWLGYDNVSRKDAASAVVGNIDEGIGEVLKSWKPITKELTRKFGKQESKSMDKSSMQKKIESLFKKSEAENPKDVIGNELPYGMMQYRDEDTKEWLPILVSINYNDRGWYYEGLAPTDYLGNFGYDEFSRGFLKTCKSGTDKCDQELVKSMKKFFKEASVDIDKMPAEEVADLTEYIPKDMEYIGKD